MQPQLQHVELVREGHLLRLRVRVRVRARVRVRGRATVRVYEKGTTSMIRRGG